MPFSLKFFEDQTVNYTCMEQMWMLQSEQTRLSLSLGCPSFYFLYKIFLYFFFFIEHH